MCAVAKRSIREPLRKLIYPMTYHIYFHLLFFKQPALQEGCGWPYTVPDPALIIPTW